MNRPHARHAHGWRWSIAFTVLIVAAGTQSKGQAPTGAAARPPAQEAPLLVLSPKAKSASWTGVHRPHTKLRDVVARHHGQADWAETVVDDESLFAQWISMGARAETDVAPGELWRAGGTALMPSRHEWLPVSGAHVRAGLRFFVVSGFSRTAPRKRPSSTAASCSDGHARTPRPSRALA